MENVYESQHSEAAGGLQKLLQVSLIKTEEPKSPRPLLKETKVKTSVNFNKSTDAHCHAPVNLQTWETGRKNISRALKTLINTSHYFPLVGATEHCI